MKEIFSLILFICCIFFIGCADMERQGKLLSFEEIYDKVENAVVAVNRTFDETDSLRKMAGNFYAKADSIKNTGIDIYNTELKPHVDSLVTQIDRLSKAQTIFSKK